MIKHALAAMLDRELMLLLSNIQGVHKVSLQFKKIIKKWNDEISQWGLFYVNQYFIKFVLTH